MEQREGEEECAERCYSHSSVEQTRSLRPPEAQPHRTAFSLSPNGRRPARRGRAVACPPCVLAITAWTRKAVSAGLYHKAKGTGASPAPLLRANGHHMHWLRAPSPDLSPPCRGKGMRLLLGARQTGEPATRDHIHLSSPVTQSRKGTTSMPRSCQRRSPRYSMCALASG